MQLPVCGVCAETGSLCSGCQQKLSRGVITDTDVRVSCFLKQHESIFLLEKAILYKAVDIGPFVVLFVEDAAPLIGLGGRVAKALGQRLFPGKRVKVIEKKATMQQNAAELLIPAKLLGVTTIYKNGRIAFRVLVAKSDLKKLPAHLPTLTRVLSDLFAAPVEIFLE